MLRVGALALATLLSAFSTAAVHADPTLRLGRADRVHRGALPARLTVSGGSHRMRAGFLGLSIEPSELSTYERAGRLFDGVVSLLRQRYGQQMLLRIGGMSSDYAWWHTARRRPPAGVFTIGEPWVAALARLVARDRLRVLLEVNLAVHSPRLAVSFVRAVAKTLPAAALAGVEVGNEPDLYFEQPWLERQRLASTEPSLPHHWTRAYSWPDYRRDYRLYARALKRSLRDVELGAPEITSPNLPWLSALTGLGGLDPSFLSIHQYPLTECSRPGSGHRPSIPRLLAERSSAALARSVAPAAVFAHRNGMAFQLTELNSISCGGTAGVSNSFAAALWAPDILFEMARAGVDGVNWHTRPRTLNAPFHLTPRGIRPLPELYGLAVFAQVTRGPSVLLESSLAASPGVHLKAWVVRHPTMITMLLINKGSRAANVTVPTFAATPQPAVLRRLQAPDVGSTSGVRYAGQWIGADARWHGAQVTTTLRPSHRHYQVVVPAWSAVTLTQPA